MLSLPATGSLHDAGSAGRCGVHSFSVRAALSALSDVIDSSLGAPQAMASVATDSEATRVGKRELMWVTYVPLISIKSRTSAEKNPKCADGVGSDARRRTSSTKIG